MINHVVKLYLQKIRRGISADFFVFLAKDTAVHYIKVEYLIIARLTSGNFY